MFLTPFGLIFASVAHFTPGQLLQGSRDEGKLTCLQVFLCVANIILFAAVSCLLLLAVQILTLKSPLLPSQEQAGLVHWMVAFSSSMLTALSLKQSERRCSLLQREHVNDPLFLLLHCINCILLLFFVHFMYTYIVGSIFRRACLRRDTASAARTGSPCT